MRNFEARQSKGLLVASAIRAFFVFKLVTHSGFEDPIVGVTGRSHIKIADLPQKKFTKHQKPRPILSALITSKTRLKLLFSFLAILRLKAI